jgi:ribosomal protein L31E
MWVAKPNLNNNNGIKEFPTAKEAVAYLEEYTGIEMAYDRNRKTKEITYDWEIIEKLWEKGVDNSLEPAII